MRVRNVRPQGQEIELQMKPMIDIVFQLLVFFIMTFKIVSPEGDFNVRMPASAPSEGPPPIDSIPPIRVRMTALSDGSLAEIQFGNRSLGRDFQKLRQAILDMVGPDPSPSTLESTEVELDCDYNLRFENTIEAITAVSGYVDQGNIVKLVENIKFAPPRGR